MHCLAETHRTLFCDFTCIVSLTLAMKIFNYKSEWVLVTVWKLKENMNKSHASNQRKCNFWNLESHLGGADFAFRLLELKKPLDEEKKKNTWSLCSSNKDVRLIMRSTMSTYPCTNARTKILGCSNTFFCFVFLERLSLLSISFLSTSSIYWISPRLLLIPERVKILHKQLCGIVASKNDLC